MKGALGGDSTKEKLDEFSFLKTQMNPKSLNFKLFKLAQLVH